MKFEIYPKYKDSGIEWIDKIPEGWRMTKLLSHIFISKGAISNKEIKKQKIIFHYSIPNLDEFDDGAEEETDTIDSNKLLLDGDEVLISKLNPRKSRIILSKKHNIPTICSTEFVPLKVRNIKKEFLLY